MSWFLLHLFEYVSTMITYNEFIHTHCQVVNNLEKAKVIRPYVPFFGSSRASALLHTLSRTKSVRRNSGLYKLGHGEKSVIWYWEFDVKKRYFHQFKTIDYAAAAEFYEANKLMMRWEDVDVDINSVPPEHKKEGTDWFAIFNPRATRQLEVSLVHTLMHEKCLILHFVVE